MTVELPSKFNVDQLFLQLAREIAMEIQPLDQILKNNNVTPAVWERIRTNTRFNQLLASNVEAWGSSLNTAERVRVKSLAMIEEVLPEFYVRMTDQKENLNHKVEALKTVAKFAGVGEKAGDGTPGERFTVTINLGADQQLKIEKNVTPQVSQVLLQSAINPDGSIDCL
jgi:hypothetical protein